MTNKFNQKKARSKIDRAKNQKWENLFTFQLQTEGLDKYFAREVLFITGRRFRLDWGDPVNKIGIEFQGAIWSPDKLGHNSGSGIMRDQEKLNLAHFEDWRIFHISDKGVRNLEAVDMIKRYYTHKLKIDL